MVGPPACGSIHTERRFEAPYHTSSGFRPRSEHGPCLEAPIWLWHATSSEQGIALAFLIRSLVIQCNTYGVGTREHGKERDDDGPAYPGIERKARGSRSRYQAQQVVPRERGNRLLYRPERLANCGDQKGA